MTHATPRLSPARMTALPTTRQPEPPVVNADHDLVDGLRANNPPQPPAVDMTLAEIDAHTNAQSEVLSAPPGARDLQAVLSNASPSASYTDDDLATANRIARWLLLHDRSRSWLARATRISSATVSSLLNLRYPSPPATHLATLSAAVDVEDARLREGTGGYVTGSVHKLVSVVCDRTRQSATIGIVCGNVGVGKTRSLHEYRASHPQTFLVEASPQMTASSLLIEVLEQLGIPLQPGMDRRFAAILRALQGTNSLLIVDEAENATLPALEYLRRIRDRARIGLVLSGTAKLHQKIKALHGQFDQLRSRVSMWPATIEGISRDDADEITRQGLPGVPQVSEDVHDALWEYCRGSVRVLTESLLPAVRDYGVNKGMPVTVELVDAVAKGVLFMAPRNSLAGRRA